MMMDRRATDRRTVAGGLDHQIMLDLNDVIREVWRRRVLVAVMVAIPTIMGFLYLVSRPDIYAATASIVIEPQEANIGEVEEAVASIRLDPMTVETQVRILASPTIVYKVIERLGLQMGSGGRLEITKQGKDRRTAAQTSSDPIPVLSEEDTKTRSIMVRRYLSSLDIKPIRSTRIIEISFKSRNPELAAEIANAHAEQYVASHIDQKTQEILQMSEWIEGQIAIKTRESMESARAVQEYREQHGIVTGRNSEELIYEQISDLSSQITPIESKKLDLQAQYDALMASPDMDTIPAVQQSAVMQKLKTELSTAEQELQALSAKFGSRHPQYREAQRKINQIHESIAKETDSIKQTLKNQLDNTIAQEQLLRQRLDELKGQENTQSGLLINLQTLEIQAENSKKLLDKLIARHDEVSAQMGFVRPDAKIVARAEIPTSPLGKNKPLTLFVIMFVSGVFAVAIAYGLSFLDTGIHGPDDVQKTLQLRMLGVLPSVKNPIAEVTGLDRSVYLEEIKRIYLNLASKPDLKTILMASAGDGEGKTAMILAFAAYLARAGKNVVVVDADMQGPDVARLSGVSETPGLADVVGGYDSLSKSIIHDDHGVALLPCGDRRHWRTDSLMSAAFREVIDDLKTRFDYVLIDCAPVLKSSDAETVAGIVDQVTMIVATTKTSKKDLKKAGTTLRKFSKEVPSVILNRADLKNVA